MGAAPLLLAMAMVIADVGWETDGRGGYQYIVQIPTEQWESVRREGSITSQIPENLRGRVSSIKIRVGDGPMPRHEIVASAEMIRKLPGPPDTDSTVRAQGGDGFQMPSQDSLMDAGKQAAARLQQEAGNQFGELTRQTGQRAGEAVENAAQDFRNTANSLLSGASNPGSNPSASPIGGPTTAPAQLTEPPALQPTNAANNRANAQPTNGPSTRPSTGPSTSATGFPSFDTSTASPWSPDPTRRSGQTGSGQTVSGQTDSTQTRTGQDYAGRDYASQGSAGQAPASQTNPNMAGTTAQTNSANSGYQTNPGYSNTSNLASDPPILNQQPSSSTVAMQQRLQLTERDFQFDEQDRLIVNESVLYVVGIYDEVEIDSGGRLVDKATNKWIRENDPRYKSVINFVNEYDSVRQERLASRNGVSGLQLSATPTAPTYTRPGSSIFDGGITANGGAGTSQPANNFYSNPNAANPNVANSNATTNPASTYSPALAMNFKDQVELEILRRERELEKEKAAKEEALAAQKASQQTNAAQQTNQVGYQPSPSDDSTTKKKQPAEMQSQPLFNFLLLLSILGNFYLGIAISRLLKRYRNLVASHRGGTTLAA